jgi:hypothetical protein
LFVVLVAARANGTKIVSEQWFMDKIEEGAAAKRAAKVCRWLPSLRPLSFRRSSVVCCIPRLAFCCAAVERGGEKAGQNPETQKSHGGVWVKVVFFCAKHIRFVQSQSLCINV